MRVKPDLRGASGGGWGEAEAERCGHGERSRLQLRLSEKIQEDTDAAVLTFWLYKVRCTGVFEVRPRYIFVYLGAFEILLSIFQDV